MEKSIKILIRDFIALVAIGLIIPHFILIKPRTLLYLLTIAYLTIEISRILPDPALSFPSKRKQMILLTFVGLAYLGFLFADRSFVFQRSILVPGVLLIGWIKLLQKNMMRKNKKELLKLLHW